MRRSVGALAPELEGACERACASLRHQVFLRGEVAVEAAVGEAHRLHQVRDTDPFEAPLAEQLGCGIEDPLPVMGCLLPAHLHPDLLRGASTGPRSGGQGYMTCVMIAVYDEHHIMSRHGRTPV